MRKRVKSLVTIVLSLLLLLMNVLGNNVQVNAQGNDVIITEPETILLVPGETKTIKVPIKAVGDNISRPVILAETEDTSIKLSQPKLTLKGIETPPNVITPYSLQYVEIDVKVAETAKIGLHPFYLIVTGTAYDINGERTVNTKLTVNTQILKEKAPAQLTVNKVEVDNPTIGKDMNLSFVVKNEGEITARNVFVSIDYAETGMIAGYTTKSVKIDDIPMEKDMHVKLPIKTLSTATPGAKTLTVNIDYKIEDGTAHKESHEIYVNLMENDDAPNLVLNDFTYNEDAKQGDNLDLVLRINNYGNSRAKNPRISVDEASVGTTKFIKNYFTENIELKNVKPDQTTSVKIPLIISKKNIGGEQELKLNLVYYNEEGVEYKSTVTIYPRIDAEGVSEDGKPIILFSNVLQSPKQPVAGGKLEVSFDIENKSAIDLNDFKISLKNLTGTTFIPVASEPYHYIDELKGGATKRITIPLTVSKNIPEGLNNLKIDYSYAGGGDSIEIPILDVQNDLGSASKPKLIVSNYETNLEELKAGSVFNFKFEVINTHNSVAAKNITLTLSGKTSAGQEVFTVTQGSNSFFVSKIGPGETYSEEIELKVKSDAATDVYPVNVTIEYEYDGIEANPITGEIGEKETHELNLQVVENARPVVDYVNVYSYDGSVIVNNPASLSFEFYNMGKSALNNVIATVEGDFTSSGSSMQFLGNVVAGGNAYAEFEVIPIVEGMANGVVKITYEDSNGEEQVYTKEFETSVMGEQEWDMGMNGDGGMDVFNPTVPEPKKAILPTWLFIVIQVAIFIVFLLVSRKVIINIYKSKLRKKEDEMY